MVIALRAMGSVVAGLALALVLVIGVELVSALVHPMPPDFQGTMEEVRAHVARYPQRFLALVVPAWGATAFGSTWLTTRLGGRVCGAVVGTILLAGVAFNVAKLPYPMWFKVANLVVIPAVIYLGIRWPGRRAPGVAEETRLCS
jgi:hypothetical protein